MKGRDSVIAAMNGLLADELAAVNQYMLHSSMAENRGYEGLGTSRQHRAVMEMRHAEMLLDRILFLEGFPNVTNLGTIQIGTDVPAQVESDLQAEYRAIAGYNAAVGLCASSGDNDTRALLERILHDEEAHANELESHRDQIADMGLAGFLQTQVSAGD